MTFCDVSIWGRKATLSRVTVYGFASVVLASLALANPVPVLHESAVVLMRSTTVGMKVNGIMASKSKEWNKRTFMQEYVT